MVFLNVGFTREEREGEGKWGARKSYWKGREVKVEGRGREIKGVMTGVKHGVYWLE